MLNVNAAAKCTLSFIGSKMIDNFNTRDTSLLIASAMLMPDV